MNPQQANDTPHHKSSLPITFQTHHYPGLNILVENGNKEEAKTIPATPNNSPDTLLSARLVQEMNKDSDDNVPE